MTFGIHKWLEPGEEVLFGDNNRFVGISFPCVRHVALILVALGIAVGTGFMVSAYLRQLAHKAGTPAEADGALIHLGDQLAVFLASGLTYIVVLAVWRALLEPVGILLTDRRMIRPTGKYRWPLESLALADIAEVRTRGSWITLVAKGPGAVLRLDRKGGSVSAGKDRVRFEAVRWKLFGSGETRNEKALRVIGREPLHWRKPELPHDVERLVSLEAKIPVLVSVLAFIPMLALGIVVMFRLYTVQGVSSAVIFPAELASTFIPLLLIWAGCHLFLWWAARSLAPEKTALFLRATVHPDWGPGTLAGASDIATRRATLKRRESIFSWLAGRPVRCNDAPGPEAFGGGWLT